jgi:hypothetical protein
MGCDYAAQFRKWDVLTNVPLSFAGLLAADFIDKSYLGDLAVTLHELLFQ